MNADQLLNPQELLAEARRATGLQQFDGPPIEEPLERLTHSLRIEAGLNQRVCKCGVRGSSTH